MKQRIKRGNILILIFMLILFAVFVFNGYECIYQKFFHIICPGCGMSRAVKALIHLDFKAALKYHPMVFTLPLIALIILTNGKIFKNVMLNRALLIVLGMGFLVLWIFRLNSAYLYI